MDTVLPPGPKMQTTKCRKEKTKKQTKKAKVLAKEYQTMFKRSKEMLQSKASTIFKEMAGFEKSRAGSKEKRRCRPPTVWHWLHMWHVRAENGGKKYIRKTVHFNTCQLCKGPFNVRYVFIIYNMMHGIFVLWLVNYICNFLKIFAMYLMHSYCNVHCCIRTPRRCLDCIQELKAWNSSASTCAAYVSCLSINCYTYLILSLLSPSNYT